MSARYIVKAPHQGRTVAYVNLPGSPFSSKRQALKAAHKAGIAATQITAVRRAT